MHPRQQRNIEELFSRRESSERLFSSVRQSNRDLNKDLIEGEGEYIFTVKNYNSLKGISFKMFMDRDNRTNEYCIEGPLGKGL